MTKSSNYIRVTFVIMAISAISACGLVREGANVRATPMVSDYNPAGNAH